MNYQGMHEPATGIAGIREAVIVTLYRRNKPASMDEILGGVCRLIGSDLASAGMDPSKLSGLQSLRQGVAAAMIDLIEDGMIAFDRTAGGWVLTALGRSEAEVATLRYTETMRYLMPMAR